MDIKKVKLTEDDWSFIVAEIEFDQMNMYFCFQIVETIRNNDLDFEHILMHLDFIQKTDSLKSLDKVFILLKYKIIDAALRRHALIEGGL